MDQVKFEKSEDIRKALKQVFNDLAAENISISHAYALTNIVGKMLQSLRLDVQVYKLTGQKSNDAMSVRLTN